MRAALFRYDPIPGFVARYLHYRVFDFEPKSFTMPVDPSREFWIHVLNSNVQATIRSEGDMIGWEEDEETVGPVALAAK